AHSATLEHEVVFGPDQIRLEVREGHMVLAAPTASREFRAGRPDLPWFGETVKLPYGTRVTAVTVLSIDTRPVADDVRIPSAMLPKAGAISSDRSLPDPAYFETNVAQPAIPAELGDQGYRRGVNEASLRVSPVRWSPKSGHLEMVTRMRLQLTLADDPHPD